MTGLAWAGVALGAVAVGAGALLLWMVWEAGRLSVEYLRFRRDGEDLVVVQAGRLPTGASPPGSGHSRLRVVQLSDLHLHRRPARPHEEALRLIRAWGPDVVVVTGDVVDRSSRPGVAEAYLERLAASAPTVLVWGNHDHDDRGAQTSMRRLARPPRLSILENRRLLVDSAAGPVELVGLDAPDLGLDRVADALLEPPVGVAGTGGEERPSALSMGAAALRITCAHTYHAIDHEGAQALGSLLLVGDTHGGQIDLPLLGPVWARWVHHHRYVRGLHRVGGRWLYVNRGLGTIGVPMRLRCPAEITLLDVEVATDS